MIDVNNEVILTLQEAARLFPGRRLGKRSSVRSVWRWVSKGHRGIKLESLKVAGRRMTSREAIARFCDQCTAMEFAGESGAAEANRQRSDQAGRELESAGI